MSSSEKHGLGLAPVEAALRGARRPHSNSRLRAMFDHQRWLLSGGQFGRQLNITQETDSWRVDFREHDLDGVDFARARFKNVKFALCNLRMARFVGARLENVSFVGCDVEGADFRDAELSAVSFPDSNYRKALFNSEIACRRPVDESNSILIQTTKSAPTM